MLNPLWRGARLDRRELLIAVARAMNALPSGSNEAAFLHHQLQRLKRVYASPRHSGPVKSAFFTAIARQTFAPS
jgi:hypothetical protein